MRSRIIALHTLWDKISVVPVGYWEWHSGYLPRTISCDEYTTSLADISWHVYLPARFIVTESMIRLQASVVESMRYIPMTAATGWQSTAIRPPAPFTGVKVQAMLCVCRRQESVTVCPINAAVFKGATLLSITQIQNVCNGAKISLPLNDTGAVNLYPNCLHTVYLNVY